MSVGLVPTTEVLDNVLPSERLLANGVAIPELRASFRHISNWRNVRAVAMVWLWTSLLAYGGVHWGALAAVVAY
jgi:hypothetical protein